MSNDRHQINNKGTMGALFRRMTMASLGLDTMDDVSEQSFAVIDQADTFAQRLMGGVSGMMPRGKFENIGVANSSDVLWESLYENILPENAPKNATDVGEWQYWLDAVLLTMFDEDEEEEMLSASSTGASSMKRAERQAVLQNKKQAITQRVAALKASGVRPSMLNQLSSSQKRAFSQNLNAAETQKLLRSENAQNSAVKVSMDAAITEFANKLIGYDKTLTSNERKNTSSIAASSDSVFASKLLQSAAALEASVLQAGNTEAESLVQSWKNEVQQFAASSKNADLNIASLQGMQNIVSEMLKKNVVSSAAAERFTDVSKTFASRALDHAVSQQLRNVMLSRIASSSLMNAQNIEAKNLTDVRISERAIVGPRDIAVNAAKLAKAESVLAAKFEKVAETIREFVEQNGENAATMRFMRAADRFDQMRGQSDEESRVLLKDMVESAYQLENAGVLPKGTVRGMVKTSETEVQQSHSNTSGLVDQIELLSRLSAGQNVESAMAKSSNIADSARFNALVNAINNLAISRADSVVAGAQGVKQTDLENKIAASFASSLSSNQGTASAKLSKFVTEIRNSFENAVSGFSRAGLNTDLIAPVAREISLLNVDEKLSFEESVDRFEVLSQTLDDFVDSAMKSISENGYDDLDFDVARNYVAAETDKSEASVGVSRSHNAEAMNHQIQRNAANIEAMVSENQRSMQEALAQNTAAMNRQMQLHTANIEKMVAESQRTLQESFAQQAFNNEAVAATIREEVAKAVSQNNASALISLTNSDVVKSLSPEVRNSIVASVEKFSKQQKEINALTQKIEEVRKASELARVLHVAAESTRVNNLLNNTALDNRTSSRVALGNAQVNAAYLPVLSETISSYVKLKNELEKGGIAQKGAKTSIATADIDRMTQLLKVVERNAQRSSAVKGSFNASNAASVEEVLRSAQISASASKEIAAALAASNPARVEEILRSAQLSASASKELGTVIGTSNAARIEEILHGAQIASADSNASAGILGTSNVARVEEMLRNVAVQDRMASSENRADSNVFNFDGFDSQVGYFDIVPDSLTVVNNNNQVSENSVRSSAQSASAQTANSMNHADSIAAGYASNNSVNNYAPILGLKKALELHAAGLTNGGVLDADALTRIVNDSAVREAVMKHEPVSIVTVNNAGERVRVTVGAAESEASSIALKRVTGESYQPASIRGLEQSAIIPSIDIKKLDNVNTISGADQFVSVVLGRNANAMADASIESQNSFNTDAEELSFASDRFEAIHSNVMDAERKLLNVSIGGSNVVMTPDAYVQSVAQPKLNSSVSELASGSGDIIESLTRVLEQSGNARSVRNLRRMYFEKLSETAKNSASGWLGLNNQSFAGLFGVESPSDSSAPTFSAYDSNRGEFLDAQASKNAASSFESSLGMTSGEFSYDNFDAASREFVSANSSAAAASSAAASSVAASSAAVNAVLASAHAANGAQASYGSQLLMNAMHTKENAKASVASGEFLSTIDSLLDYVEDVSNRNVGVFSTNEVVRVLVEQLPSDSYLGERGLPKWRQRDARARQVMEARELREALKKIGATPIQGMQRVNDKNYVSPNLIPQQSQAAPLFSGGSDGGSGALANSAGAAGGNDLDSSSLPVDDLRIIAEEIYEMILDSLNEELQRRRSE